MRNYNLRSCFDPSTTCHYFLCSLWTKNKENILLKKQLDFGVFVSWYNLCFMLLISTAQKCKISLKLSKSALGHKSGFAGKNC